MIHSPQNLFGAAMRASLFSLGFAASCFLPARAFAAFDVTSSGGDYVVDTGAGLVFRIEQSSGDMVSLVYAGKQLQDQTKGSHIGSGFGTATVTATKYGNNYIKITSANSAGNITHYYMARNGYNNIYMATYTTDDGGELRYIARLSTATLPNAPVTASDIRNNIGAIESGDVFGLSNGQTRSKYYGRDRAIDLDANVTGATGSGVGVYMIFGNREKSSGGPFFRDIQNQTGAQNEVYNYMFSGHEQTEAARPGLNGPYAYVITNGTTPSANVDFSWIESGGLGLKGFVPSTGRGRVILNGIAGRDTNYPYTVGFDNDTAQYWTSASGSNGSVGSYNMIPGTYTMSVYKGELAVYTRTGVAVSAGQATTLNTVTVNDDPSTTATIWRIGNWDGTPNEFKNAANIPIMHPQDVRQGDWGPITYTVGSNSPSSFPSCEWNATDVNDPTTIKFNLTAAQVAAHTVKIGISVAYAGGRPKIKVNSWNSSNPSASSQPDSRSITTGTYRGNNATYTYNVPASAFVTGTNTMTLDVISGSGNTSGYLSAAVAYDCVELDN